MARSARGRSGQARDFARIRQRLDGWRGSHNRGVAFPPALWSAAGRVAQRHGVFRTARALGLEYSKLKRMSGGVIARVSRKGKLLSKPSAMQFIELTGALPVSASGCWLSLRHADGQRLKLEMAPSAATEMVLQLCRSGWGTL